MQTVTTIGLDIAKSVFQIHGVDAAGNVIVRRKLKRRYVLPFFQKLPPCLVGIEACASSHHWSRELRALGHTVRLMPPAYVRPYVKRQKNDAADAEAICEAVTRENMRFVATETPEQQSRLMLHRTRHLFIRQQTAVINAIRAHLAEFGIVAPVGRNGVELLGVVADASDKRLPEIAHACLLALGAQLRTLKVASEHLPENFLATSHGLFGLAALAGTGEPRREGVVAPSRRRSSWANKPPSASAYMRSPGSALPICALSLKAVSQRALSSNSSRGCRSASANLRSGSASTARGSMYRHIERVSSRGFCTPKNLRPAGTKISLWE